MQSNEPLFGRYRAIDRPAMTSDNYLGNCPDQPVISDERDMRETKLGLEPDDRRYRGSGHQAFPPKFYNKHFLFESMGFSVVFFFFLLKNGATLSNLPKTLFNLQAGSTSY